MWEGGHEHEDVEKACSRQRTGKGGARSESLHCKSLLPAGGGTPAAPPSITWRISARWHHGKPTNRPRIALEPPLLYHRAPQAEACR